jgi:hypothetical protein
MSRINTKSALMYNWQFKTWPNFIYNLNIYSLSFWLLLKKLV